MLELEIIKTDIFELAGQSVDIIKYSADKKKIEVLLNLEPSMPRFGYFDPIRLKQILANLLGNAVKFTESGEIELKISFEKLQNDKGIFKFSVSDSGIGITEEQKTKLFRVFSQADSSVTRKYGGTGLGLVISQMIAERMNSNIEIQSEYGKGTTFSFMVETDFVFGEKVVLGDNLKVKRCLIIDDNQQNRTILEHTLNYWSIDCESCDNGFDGIELLKKSQKFDILICDYNMPQMDGLQTIRLIRNELKNTPEILPIILLHSSSEDAYVQNQCVELDVQWRLIKPVKNEELFKLLHRIQGNLLNNELSEKENNEIKNYSIKTILLVEDVPMNMMLIKFLIDKALPNVKIVEAVNGREAIEKWQLFSPDLILMDIQMPELDGIETTTIIRELENKEGKIKNTTIIALTAGALEEERNKCIAAGMNDFLTKPINQDKFFQTLEKYSQVNI
jgi:CheY-like chemotaxis protein